MQGTVYEDEKSLTHKAVSILIHNIVYNCVTQRNVRLNIRPQCLSHLIVSITSAPTGREWTPFSQRLAIVPQQYRAGPADDDGDEGEQGIAPAEAEAVVEAGREEGKAEACQGAHDGGGADGAGGVAGVGVDEEALDALETDDGADGEEAGADIGADPVRLVLGSPAVDEEAHRDEDGAGHHHGDTVLGAASAFAAVADIALLERGVDAVLQRGAHLGAQEEAEAERDVVEAADAQGLTVAALGDGTGEQ